MRIRSDHPLRQMFADLADKHIASVFGAGDREMARYIAELLVDFTHAGYPTGLNCACTDLISYKRNSNTTSGPGIKGFEAH